MRFTGFIGPSYTLQSKNVDTQRCVNLYPEINEVGFGKEREVASLVATPGLSLKTTVGSGPFRGAYTASNGYAYICSGARLYKVDSSYNVTELGSIATSQGQVSMTDNGTSLVLVDGVNGWVVTLASNAFAQITDPDFLPASHVAFLDGYFVFNELNSGRFFISDLNSATSYDALNFATAEGSPDNIVGIIADHRDLFLFGQNTTEVFYNSGNADFPFDRIQGAFVEQGCAAGFSIAKMQNYVYWLGRNDQGDGVVYRARGYFPERISTHAVEFAISGYADIDQAVAYTYQEGGHSFYVLNFVGQNTTWVFDASTNLWHERAYNNNGQLERHRASVHTFAFGVHLVGDRDNSNLYEMSSSTYTDNGQEIPRIRSSPHISNGLKRIFYRSLQLDIEVGVGLDGASTVQGNDPQAMLQWSDDGGHSWSNERWTSFGKIGERKIRAIWRRLGQSRDRVFRVWITDPNKVTIIGAEFDAEIGRS